MTPDFPDLQTEDRIRDIYRDSWTVRDASRLREILKRERELRLQHL
jgi:hypothetical protein